MPWFRLPAFLAALLSVGGAGASDRVDIRVTLVLVDACTVHSRGHAGEGRVRVDCPSGQPYVLEARRAEDRASSAGDAGTPTRPGASGGGATIVF